MTRIKRRSTTAHSAFSRDRLAVIFTAFASVPALFSLPSFLSGMMIAVICAIAFLFGSSKRPVYGEPLALLAIVWFLAAALPVLLPGLYVADYYRPRVPERLIDLSALWLYRAWASIALGYWMARVFGRKAAAPPLTVQAASRERAFETSIGLVGIFGLVARISLGGGVVSTFDQAAVVETSTIGQIASYLVTCSYIYVFMCAARPGSLARNFSSNWLFLGNLLGSIAFGAISGAKAGMFAPLVALALGLALRPRLRVTPWKDLAICAGSFAAVYAISVAVTAYRILSFMTPVPYSSNPVSIIFSQAWIFLKATYLGLTGAIPASPDLLARFSHVTGLSLVFEVSGQVSPKYGFLETFLTPIYAIAPRDWLPSKVIFFNSGEMASIMGWSFGGLSVTYPGSIYWSLGYAGIVPMCFLTGWLVCGLHKSSTSGRFRGMARFALIPLMLILLDVGAEFHSTVINLVRFFILGAFMMWVVNLLQSTARAVRRT